MKDIKSLTSEFVREGDIEGLPSASGIEKVGDIYYVIGDDAPWLYLLNNEMSVIDKIRISPDAPTIDGRIIKKEKRDYEAMTLAFRDGKPELLIFGSGSFPKKRDFMYRGNLEGDGREHDLNDLYNNLREILKNRNGEMNLEAAIFWNNNVLLLNRDKNIIFSLSIDRLHQYLDDGGPLPEPEILQYDLPQINGIEAGFSGAYLIHDSNLMLFTATVEDTQNWYQDGDILGSFIGIIDLSKREGHKPLYIRVMDGEKPYAGKLESLVVKEYKNDELLLIAVRDNDDGSSSFVEMKLFLERE